MNTIKKRVCNFAHPQKDADVRVVRQPRRTGSYTDALQWIAHNDDTDWLDDENGVESVTLSLVADVFGRSVEEATADLRRAVKKAKEEKRST